MNVFGHSIFALTNVFLDFILNITATVKRCIFEQNHQITAKTQLNT